MKKRNPAFHFILFLLFAYFAGAVSAQISPNLQMQKSSSTELKSGETIKKQIAGGESQNLTVNLVAAQFLSVAVEQLGIDVIIALFAPDGKKLIEVDSPIGATGTERLMFIAPVSGTYILQISTSEKTAKPAAYEAKISELRPSTQTDAQRIRAAALVVEAFTTQEKRTAEDFTKAIRIYQDALGIYVAIGDRAGEGLVRGRLGQLYTFIGQAAPRSRRTRRLS